MDDKDGPVNKGGRLIRGRARVVQGTGCDHGQAGQEKARVECQPRCLFTRVFTGIKPWRNDWPFSVKQDYQQG